MAAIEEYSEGRVLAGAASWDGFQKADIREPLILPTTAFRRHA
jgi:hypothetical protein